jgi:DNA-binding beta-propeller fold protein YncE
MAEADGMMCEWIPASASANLFTALPQEGQAEASEFSSRKPIRTIRDSYAAYSAIAVDPVNNEVVLTDENLFQILVYDRLANTPPNARMTEPKRMLGGLDTKIEFQCGLYIDPRNGDIYAVNNDTVDTLVIFNRQARGNVPPTRQLATPHGTFGIAVDEDKEEMYLTVQHDNAISVFHKYAQGDDHPIRLLQGIHTLLADPHGIAFDKSTGEMFVTNQGSFHDTIPGQNVGRRGRGEGKANWPDGSQAPGSGVYYPPSITVYPMDASGDTPPLRIIQGPKTQLNWPAGVAVDEERGEIIVANDMGHEILYFDSNATGDVAPARVLKGPKTNVKNPTGIYLDLENDELWVANFGNHSATVYRRGASGDTPPMRTIRSGPADEPALGIGNPHPVAYDSKREQILVPN